MSRPGIEPGRSVVGAEHLEQIHLNSSLITFRNIYNYILDLDNMYHD
jgi:hypothetical protein